MMPFQGLTCTDWHTLTPFMGVQNSIQPLESKYERGVFESPHANVFLRSCTQRAHNKATQTHLHKSQNTTTPAPIIGDRPSEAPQFKHPSTKPVARLAPC